MCVLHSFPSSPTLEPFSFIFEDHSALTSKLSEISLLLSLFWMDASHADRWMFVAAMYMGFSYFSEITIFRRKGPLVCVQFVHRLSIQFFSGPILLIHNARFHCYWSIIVLSHHCFMLHHHFELSYCFLQV